MFTTLLKFELNLWISYRYVYSYARRDGRVPTFGNIADCLLFQAVSQGLNPASIEVKLCGSDYCKHCACIYA